jgi:hypothetical protein
MPGHLRTIGRLVNADCNSQVGAKPQGRMANVFLSYARQNAVIAKRIAEALRAKGLLLRTGRVGAARPSERRSGSGYGSHFHASYAEALA